MCITGRANCFIYLLFSLSRSDYERGKMGDEMVIKRIGDVT